MKKYVKKDFCGIFMPSEKYNMLEFNIEFNKWRQKKCHTLFMQMLNLIKKIDGCANNPENSSTTEICVHIPCGYSMSRICAFDRIENKRTLYRERRNS